MLQPIPPQTQPVIESPSVTMDRVWFRFLQALATGALTFVPVPAGSSAPGSVNQLAQDGSFLYICIASNTWARVAISSW